MTEEFMAGIEAVKRYKPKNVVILTRDLVKACRHLGEVKVMACGSLYATLELNDAEMQQLADAEISFGFS